MCLQSELKKLDVKDCPKSGRKKRNEERKELQYHIQTAGEDSISSYIFWGRGSLTAYRLVLKKSYIYCYFFLKKMYLICDHL